MSADHLQVEREDSVEGGTLLLALSGWMDGGDVSTGTVRRLIELLNAERIGRVDPEGFYILNFPGSMEISSLFRPHIEIEDGQIKSLDLPDGVFHASTEHGVVCFVGKEPNLRWGDYGDCLFEMARRSRVARILFVGSFGGVVPHTRQPRLFMTVSDASLLAPLEQYGLRRANYEGPGSFTSYLLSRAKREGFEMVSIAAEVPGYLQGTNPASIEAVTRRLAQILGLDLDLQELRAASTHWELKVSEAVDEDQELAEKVRQLEREYDNELIEAQGEEG